MAARRGAWDEVMGDADGKILIDLSAPIIVDMEEGSQSGTTTMEDIPVKALSARATRVTHVLDVYDGKLDAPLDFEAVKNVLESKAYSELPAPLAPKGRVPCEYTMQVVMRMPSEDRVEMVKHFTLKEGQSAGKINAFVQGKACTVDWGAQKDYRQARTALQIMMSRIAGFRALCYEAGDAPLASEKEKKLLSKEDIERGFAFIEQEAPRSNFKNAALMWITIQENDPSSPVFGWPVAKIKDAIANLRAEANLARTQYDYPLCYFDMTPFFQKIVDRVLPSLLEKSLLLFGEPGIGKSPVAYVLAMVCARHQIRVGELVGVSPSFRSTPDLDFLRGEEGRRDRPDVFDDGDFNSMTPKALKAFLDVMVEEAMTRERWGAAKFVRGQARFACDNKYDPAAIDDEDPNLTLDTFLAAIRPAFPPNMCKPDVMAILKRASVILNTRDHIYVKLAARPEIERFDNEGSYITEEAARHLNAYYKSGINRDFGGLLDREAAMAADAFQGYQTPNGRPVSSKEAKAVADRESAGASMFGGSYREHLAKLAKLGLSNLKRRGGEYEAPAKRRANRAELSVPEEEASTRGT